MAEIELVKCPNCGGDLTNTKVRRIGDHKEFICRNCMQSLGIIKE